MIRNNLPQLLSYKDMKALLERQDPEYRKLADEICTTHISYPGLQAVLKLLLAERVSIRNLHLIIEAIAEIAPHVRRTEQIVEHVRVRMAQQICGDLSEGGVLKVLRLGNRWDLAFHQSLKRDAKGEIREFDIDPRQLEEFGADATKAIRALSGGRRALRHRHRAGRAALCAHDHRAPVHHPAGAVPCRNRQGRGDPHPRHHLVTATAETLVIAAFLAFCRIGGCFMLMPGLSSARVPLQVRLFVAVARHLRAARQSVGPDRPLRQQSAGCSRADDRVGTPDRRADRPAGAHLHDGTAVHGHGDRHADRLHQHRRRRASRAANRRARSAT